MDEALPERLRPDGDLLVRRWTADDATALGVAITESAEQLQPWLPWVANEPLRLAARRALIDDWEQAWLSGASVLLGAFERGEIVGGTSMHRRPRGGIELGYWVRTSRQGHGFATRIARIVTDTALSLPDVDYTEIHHDQANATSAAIPRKLGYTLIEKVEQPPVAPGELGIEWRWRMERSAWRPTEN